MKKKKIIDYKISRFSSVGSLEANYVKKITKSGILSDYMGKAGKNFLGGEIVKKFEKKIENYFNVKYAITVNSWTSGLISIFGAIGLSPGDEVIMPNWTMSACAMSVIHWNAIPIFVDIEDKTFNIDPDKIEAKITNKTKAILVVDIFGHPADYKKLNRIAKKYKLKIISDSAQSIGSKYNNKFTGTFSLAGGYSFNCHKHINTGEGGVILTNSKKIATRARLIRNHAESSLNQKYTNKSELINMIGYNFRLGELESAIGICQLQKLKKIIELRRKFAFKLSQGLSNLKGLRLPIIKKNCTHSFYTYPIILKLDELKVSRSYICKLLRNEGVNISEGYVNLHSLPIFKHKIGYGNKNFPWSLNGSKKYIYKDGDYPVSENLHKKSLIHLSMYTLDYKLKDIDNIIKCFQKVWKKIKN